MIKLFKRNSKNDKAPITKIGLTRMGFAVAFLGPYLAMDIKENILKRVTIAKTEKGFILTEKRKTSDAGFDGHFTKNITHEEAGEILGRPARDYLIMNGIISFEVERMFGLIAYKIIYVPEYRLSTNVGGMFYTS